jgi:hypothetical protein
MRRTSKEEAVAYFNALCPAKVCGVFRKAEYT